MKLITVVVIRVKIRHSSSTTSNSTVRIAMIIILFNLPFSNPDCKYGLSGVVGILQVFLWEHNAGIQLLVSLRRVLEYGLACVHAANEAHLAQRGS